MEGAQLGPQMIALTPPPIPTTAYAQILQALLSGAVVGLVGCFGIRMYVKRRKQLEYQKHLTQQNERKEQIRAKSGQEKLQEKRRGKKGKGKEKTEHYGKK